MSLKLSLPVQEGGQAIQCSVTSFYPLLPYATHIFIYSTKYSKLLIIVYTIILESGHHIDIIENLIAITKDFLDSDLDL